VAKWVVRIREDFFIKAGTNEELRRQLDLILDALFNGLTNYVVIEKVRRPRRNA